MTSPLVSQFLLLCCLVSHPAFGVVTASGNSTISSSHGDSQGHALAAPFAGFRNSSDGTKPRESLSDLVPPGSSGSASVEAFTKDTNGTDAVHVDSRSEAVAESEAAAAAQATASSSLASVSPSLKDVRAEPVTLANSPALNATPAAAAVVNAPSAASTSSAADAGGVAGPAGAGEGSGVRKSVEAVDKSRAVERAETGGAETGGHEGSDGAGRDERRTEKTDGAAGVKQGVSEKEEGSVKQGVSEQQPPVAAATAPVATNSTTGTPADSKHNSSTDVPDSNNKHDSSSSSSSSSDDDSDTDPNCHHVRDLLTPAEQCAYVTSHPSCQLGSWLNYLSLYYCRSLSLSRGVAAAGMAVWLGALFFMLGNTAADFFCPSLEQLSHLLRLPPTVAGVTLLPLGNGAPDVFASIAAFVGTGQGQVGLNSVLGAATFVSCVVAGAVCIVAATAAAARSRAAGPAGARKLVDATVVDGPSFIRDVSFFITALLVLFVIVCMGRVHLWAALLFFSIYIAYCCCVASFQLSSSAQRPAPLPSSAPAPPHLQQPLLPVDQWEGEGGAPRSGERIKRTGAGAGEEEEEEEMEGGEGQGHGGESGSHGLPQWMWTRDVRIFQLERHHAAGGHGVSSPGAFMEMEDGADEDSGGVRPLWGWGSEDEEEEEEEEEEDVVHSWEPPSAPVLSAQGIAYWFFCLPAMLPRLLTIPLLPRDSRSRVLSLLSLALSPLFFLLVLQGPSISPMPLSLAAACGALLSLLGLLASSGPSGAKHLAAAVLGPSATAHHRTHHHRFTSLCIPPHALGLLWVVPGFVMSVVWFYVVANELVALLVSAAIVLRVSSAILGLTLLAWGNSIGDFVANLALAYGGGGIGGGGGMRGRSERAAERVQIAWSGCYAGPMFNTLVGIGMSLVLTSWHSYPLAFVIPEDPTLPYTFVFLLFGLVLSLVILPLSNYRLTRPLGVSLVFVYVSFLALRLFDVMGIVTLTPWW